MRCCFCNNKHEILGGHSRLEKQETGSVALKIC